MDEHPAKETNEWIRRSEYDFATAEAMLQTKRYLYVTFCCQQAIEKYLKAIIVSKTGKMPPRLHDLIRLTERAGIKLDRERFEELEILNGYYIESRYPEELEKISIGLDKKIASAHLRATKEFLSWLGQQKN